MICPHCLTRGTGRLLNAGPWLHTNSLPSTRLASGRLSVASRSARRAATADGRIPSRSYHSSEPLASSEPAPTPNSAATTSSATEGLTATKSRARMKQPSSVPAGTPLKGLSYTKNGSDPIAEADSEYPSWLWTCLDEQGKGKSKDAIQEEEMAGDMYCEYPSYTLYLAVRSYVICVIAKSKKERRQAAKRLRKLAASNPEQLAPKVPLVERSIDLPSNPEHSIQGAMEALDARQELTRALRAKRRAGIKQKNFLKGMR